MASTRKDARKIVNKLKAKSGSLRGDVLNVVKNWLDTSDYRRCIEAVACAARKDMVDLDGEPSHPQAIYLHRQDRDSSPTQDVDEPLVLQAIGALRRRQGCETILEVDDFSHLTDLLGLSEGSQQLIEATIRKLEDRGNLILDQSIYPWQLMFLEETSLSAV